MEITSRQEAMKSGATRYFTGKPCKNGHTTERWTSDGSCIECRRLLNDRYSKSEAGKQQRKKYVNSDRRKAYFATWRKTEKGQALMRKYGREYASSESGRAARKAWRKSENDAAKNNRIADILRSRLRHAVLGRLKVGSAIKSLGCSIPELRGRLESMFRDGMTWGNYGDWHIDHIKPLSGFDLTDPAQLLEACHYSNLRPLWARENLAKGARSAENW